MDEPPSSEDIFRSWNLSQVEVWRETFESLTDVDSTPAWHHFEELFASRGYELLYNFGPEELKEHGQPKPRRPAVDLSHGLGDPFRPDVASPVPFVYHDPSGFPRSYENCVHNLWLIGMHPQLVYAYDKYNRLVIIKVLRIPDGNAEVEILRTLNSDHLRSFPENHTIPLLEHITTDEGWQFLVMPAWRMTWESSFKAWQVDEYLNVAIQILEGVAFMHKNGFAHGDLSIDNFLFNQDGTVPIEGMSLDPVLSRWDFRVAIIDFGLATKFDLNIDPSSWVSTCHVGTRVFNSPEKISTEQTGIPFQALPADIYAVGAVLKHILATEENTLNGFRQFSKYPVFAHEVLKEYVPEYEMMLNRMTNDDPVRRPTAEDALEQLKGLRESLPNHIRVAPPEGYPASLIFECDD